ncbi:vitelline membrane outer layer protein 1 homolog [Corapipo altera]|uniref:vitelline membrane outer layer protein 1 homolog n=1 Tax=Corapipo altera TaxID=415028 RepID=UPI000FD681FC|nr:vitelline membrane outer layer protein 1 homolog [Corapipo altera]
MTQPRPPRPSHNHHDPTMATMTQPRPLHDVPPRPLLPPPHPSRPPHPGGVSGWGFSPDLALVPLPTPSPPRFGSWSRAATCPNGDHLVAFRLTVEAPRGVWDDTAANDMTGLCSHGSHVSPTFNPRGSLGDWSPTCPPGWGVCGIRTRVDQSEDDIDDTGLNDVQLLCCPPL